MALDYTAYSEVLGPKIEEIVSSYEARFHSNTDGIADRPMGEVLKQALEDIFDAMFPGFVQDGWTTKSYNWYLLHEDELANLADKLCEEAEAKEVIPEEE